MESHSIVWPPSLLQRVEDHLRAVEDAVAPTLPPVFATQTSVYSFFTQYHSLLSSELEELEVQKETTECCILFVIGILEHSCRLSFLFPRERRMVTTAAQQKERRLLGPPKGGNVKKRRVEPVDSTLGYGKFSRVLTLEYLLRLFVSLPQVVGHYEKLGGTMLPSFSREPLWKFVNKTLEVLQEHPELFCPLDTYIPLR